MNKSELIERIAEDAGTDKAAAGRVLEATLKRISEALAGGESVALAGFGTFESRERSARTGRNPQTGESIDIAASKTAGFKPASALKKLLND